MLIFTKLESDHLTGLPPWKTGGMKPFQTFTGNLQLPIALE